VDIKGGIGDDIHRAVATIPKSLGIVTGLGIGPGILLSASLRSIDKDHVMPKSVLERTITMRTLERWRRRWRGRPLAADSLEEQTWNGYWPRELLHPLPVKLHVGRAFATGNADIQCKARDIVRGATEAAFGWIPREVDGARLHGMHLGLDGCPVHLCGD